MARPVGPGREAQRAQARDGRGLITVRAAVEYDGSAFHGLQYQASLRSIAGVLERELSRLLAEPIKISAAGRTDTGVHATGQVVSFRTSRDFPFERLALALNSELPSDVSVRDVAVMPDSFSARFSARARTYIYAIYASADKSALLARSAYHVYRPLDVDLMHAAIAPLIGRRDFRSFCGMLPSGGVTVRNLTALEIERRGRLIRLSICADGFLHHMVRTIVGTLVDIGIGRRDPTTMSAILEARDRRAAGPTAPAQGLYLAGVRYEDGYDSYREPPIFASGLCGHVTQALEEG